MERGNCLIHRGMRHKFAACDPLGKSLRPYRLRDFPGYCRKRTVYLLQNRTKLFVANRECYMPAFRPEIGPKVFISETSPTNRSRSFFLLLSRPSIQFLPFNFEVISMGFRFGFWQVNISLFQMECQALSCGFGVLPGEFPIFPPLPPDR